MIEACGERPCLHELNNRYAAKVSTKKGSSRNQAEGLHNSFDLDSSCFFIFLLGIDLMQYAFFGERDIWPFRRPGDARTRPSVSRRYLSSRADSGSDGGGTKSHGRMIKSL